MDYQKLANDLYLQNIQLRLKVEELERKLLKFNEQASINMINAEINARNAEHNAMISQLSSKLFTI